MTLKASGRLIINKHMKINFTLSVLMVLITNHTFAQTTLHSNIKTECFSNNNYQNNSVKEFKNELTLKLDIIKLKIDKTTEKISFTYTEKIKNESSLILINDSIAFKLCIGRVTEYKAIKYLYKADLYRKYDNCWRVASSTNYWNEFHPGVISSGLGFGYEGNLGYLGFDGTLIVE